jgi:hypothetical protein
MSVLATGQALSPAAAQSQSLRAFSAADSACHRRVFTAHLVQRLCGDSLLFSNAAWSAGYASTVLQFHSE